MASLEAFEGTLKEVVHAKRLSASKMARLTEIAMKSMQNDTQLVSILYRTHKSLAPSQKVSSLYVFDALVRAARGQVVKHGITTPEPSGKGNSATFLSKIEGVVDGFFEDMISTGNSEAKDKTRKILDIWVKSNTLPPGVLKRLGDLIKDTKDKEPPEKINPIDPRNHLSPTSITPPIASNVTTTTPQTILPAAIPSAIPAAAPPAAVTPGTTDALQSTLLALLSQAANTAPNGTNFQTGTNIAAVAGAGLVNTAGLDVNQLALLQQLTQSAKAGPASGSSPAGNQKIPHVPQPSMMGMGGRNGIAGPSNPHPPHTPSYRSGIPESGYGDPRYGGGESGRGFHDDEYHDDRRDRGFGRGGRGGRGRGRWGEGDERHNSWDHRGQRERGGDWGSRSPQAGLPPPLMSRGRRDRSRSRSPPPRNRFGAGTAGGARRDPRPYSPPGRSAGGNTTKNGTGTHADQASGGGPQKDEFGRDIRPASVDRDTEPSGTANSSSVVGSSSALLQDPKIPIVGAPIPTYEEPMPATGGFHAKAMGSSRMGAASVAPVKSLPIATYESRDVVSGGGGGSGGGSGGGIQSFDFSKFEFTSPASWEALGKAWQITNGYFPSQEELLQFVMMSTGVGPMAGSAVEGAEGDSSRTEPLGSSEQWQGENGVNSEVGSRKWDHGGSGEAAYGTSVDTWDVTAKGNNVQEENHSQDAPVLVDGSVGSSGKMQKIGDRWVFVRS